MPSTDSTTAPAKKKSAILFNERFMAARFVEGCFEILKLSLRKFFFFVEDYRNDDVGVGKGHSFSGDTRPGAGFKSGDFVKEKLGGYHR